MLLDMQIIKIMLLAMFPIALFSLSEDVLPFAVWNKNRTAEFMNLKGNIVDTCSMVIRSHG